MGYAHSARERNCLDGGVALETTNAAAGAAFFHCVPSSTFRIGDKPTKSHEKARVVRTGASRLIQAELMRTPKDHWLMCRLALTFGPAKGFGYLL